MSQMVYRLMMFLTLAMLCSCRSPMHSSNSVLSHDKPALAGPHAVSGSPRSLPSFSATIAGHSSTDLVFKGSPAFHWTDEPDANSLPPVLAANMTCSCGRGHSNALESGSAEPTGACSGAGPCNPDSPGSWYDDEYLCDGGDQETEVTLNQKREVRGLDPEDTVAHFDTRDGRTLVKPSNSVCIYAPRFAAIRQVVVTNVDDRQLAMEAINNPLPPVIESAPHNPRQIEQPLPSPNVSSLRGPLALRDRTRGRELMNLQTVDELAMDFAAYEDFQVIRLGIHDRSQRALVQERVNAAIAWTENVSPEVILGEDPAIIDTSVEETGTIHHVDERGNPRLRVIKLASTGSARPGEEVEFTLRFDNIGNQPISNVTLIDRLTTRLEYLPDSAQSSLKASFRTQPHDTDSLVLRWEIREAIKPGEGGIIRFRCKVR